jgi:hypothetical protein
MDRMNRWPWFRASVAARPATHLICYTKAGCCLCDQAEKALGRLAARGLAAVEYVPIEGDPALMATYGTRIPVVTTDDGAVLAEGKVSEVWLARALQAPSGVAGPAR